METLMILTYSAFCWLIFKIFKIKVNKWSLTTAVLGGVILIASMMMIMAYFHPASVKARSYFVTTQILPNVKGKVIEVNVKANEPLKKGDILFKIDPTPYKAKYESIKVRLDFAKKRLEQSKELARIAGGSKFDIEEYQKQVEDLTAQLAEAKFNLDSCIVRAPANGFVTHLRVRPGQMAVPFPVSPLMTFVNTDSMTFIAGFEQEPMQNLKEGFHVEAIFPGIPGRIFKGKITKVLPVMAEGELSPNSSMYSFSRELPPGLVPVVFSLDYDKSKYFIPAGSETIVAVYSDKAVHFAMIRMVLMRMKMWTFYLKFH
jgi:multidrug resistance efflux pump